MEHYITEIKIEKLRHLSGIDIKLNEEKKTNLYDYKNLDCDGFILADDFGCYKVILKASPSGMNAKFLDKRAPLHIISVYIVLTPVLTTNKGKSKGKEMK